MGNLSVDFPDEEVAGSLDGVELDAMGVSLVINNSNGLIYPHHVAPRLNRNGDLAQTTRNGHLLAASSLEPELGDPMVLSGYFF